MTPTSPQPLRLDRLRIGRWTLLWLGNLRPSTDNPTGYEILAYFKWAASGYRDVLEVSIPLTALPLLRLQSLWEDNVLRKLPDGDRLRLTVSTRNAMLSAPWNPNKFGEDTLTRADYVLHGKRELARCWTFAVQPTGRLIVPVWEVLRAWYLFEPKVIPAMLAGIRHVEGIARGLRPYLSETRVLPGGTLQYVAPRWLGERDAKRMARLVFDPIANDRAYDIYRQLMQSTHNREVALPAVLPPYDGNAEWTVTCKPLSPHRDGSPRWLALSLDAATISDSIRDIQYVEELDNRQGLNKDDPTLPTTVWRRPARPANPLTDPISVTGLGPDSGIEEAALEGLDFHDSITETIQLHRKDKLLQVSKSVHRPADPVHVAGVGTDHAARPTARHARAALAPDDDVGPPVDLMERTLGAFRTLVRDAGSSSTDTWRGRLVVHDAAETFRIRSADGRSRHFAVLEMTFKSGRTVYLADAQRFGTETFSMAMFRMPHYQEVPPYLLRQWLRHFPARSGDPWVGYRIAPYGWIVEPTKHQPQLRHLTKQQVDEQFVARMWRKLAVFVDGA